jgi:hypothetical protein
MTDKMSADRLRSGLSQFVGTGEWHRYSPLFRQFLLTDGTKFLCENAGAYWLADAIGSHIFTSRKLLSPQKNPMQFWKLSVKNGAATLTCTDGGKHGEQPVELVRQEIEYTDFPLDEIDLWAIWDTIVDPKGAFVLLLPSEY